MIEKNNSSSNKIERDKEIKENYDYHKTLIESELKMWFFTALIEWIIFMIWKKYMIEWKRNKYYAEYLSDVLELIWKLLKDKKLMVELYEVKDKEKEKDWDIKSIWWLDPCKIEDEEELDKKIRDWQSWVIETYKELEKKYWRKSAEILFYMIFISSTDCYEGEVKID